MRDPRYNPYLVEWRRRLIKMAPSPDDVPTLDCEQWNVAQRYNSYVMAMRRAAGIARESDKLDVRVRDSRKPLDE